MEPTSEPEISKTVEQFADETDARKQMSHNVVAEKCNLYILGMPREVQINARGLIKKFHVLITTFFRGPQILFDISEAVIINA